MNDKEHLAVEANKKSIQYAMSGDKQAWLALYTDDAIVCDPVGKSPMDPEGNGHQGVAAIEAFWDSTIGPANLEITVNKRWTSGEHCCCVAQVARNTYAEGKYADCDMLAQYEVNDEGLITRMAAHWDFDDMMEQIAKLDLG
ncbi:MAG: nuclear transport factor 2 family protein [Pseudomonadota bacterium]